MSLAPAVTAALQRARAAEKLQALFYRALAAAAEAAEDADAVERLNGLHADEQHHLSRLSARLVELGEPLEELGGTNAPRTPFAGWEAVARERERGEIARYEALLRLALDERTARIVHEFLEAERRHASALGGKWMHA